MVRLGILKSILRCIDVQFSFGTVGMYSAVSNLGAGGTQNVSLSDTSNGVLYGMFALTGLVSGGINNGLFEIMMIQ